MDFLLFLECWFTSAINLTGSFPVGFALAFWSPFAPLFFIARKLGV
jgi:hypothetical protein